MVVVIVMVAVVAAAEDNGMYGVVDAAMSHLIN